MSDALTAAFTTKDIRFFATGLDHPEGVAVDSEGIVYCGGEAGQVYRIDPANGSTEIFGNTGGYCLGITLHADGRVFVCDPAKHAVLVIGSNGSCEVFANRCNDQPFRTPNFAVFDRSGSLYVSDSGDWEAVNGCIYRISPEGSVSLFHGGPLSFANGLALDDEEKNLYVVESTAHRVLRIPIEDGGSAGEAVEFARDLARVPDGLAFDHAGRLYVTCYASDTIYRCSAEGTIQILCTDPDGYVLNRPTNCAFLGNDLLIANLGGEHIAALNVGTTGMPLWHHR
jgi:gluconolactonase